MRVRRLKRLLGKSMAIYQELDPTAGIAQSWPLSFPSQGVVALGKDSANAHSWTCNSFKQKPFSGGSGQQRHKGHARIGLVNSRCSPKNRLVKEEHTKYHLIMTVLNLRCSSNARGMMLEQVRRHIPLVDTLYTMRNRGKNNSVLLLYIVKLQPIIIAIWDGKGKRARNKSRKLL